jgi:hypothetical protein
MPNVSEYFACRWDHDLSDEPVVIYEELGPGRVELRKVHEYRDGRRERTERVAPELRTSLSWVPVPEEAAITGQPEFTTMPLTAQEFEAVWWLAHDAE